LGEGADLLLINKFGKHEADGRGFRDTIGKALAAGVPIIVGANKLNVQALIDFCDGMAVELAPEVGVLRDWVLTPE
jgi:nucleoside-triphosphatase THEP1